MRDVASLDCQVQWGSGLQTESCSGCTEENESHSALGSKGLGTSLAQLAASQSMQGIRINAHQDVIQGASCRPQLLGRIRLKSWPPPILNLKGRSFWSTLGMRNTFSGDESSEHSPKTGQYTSLTAARNGGESTWKIFSLAMVRLLQQLCSFS